MKVKRSCRERLITRSEIVALFANLYERRRKDQTEAEYRNRENVGHTFQMAALTGVRISEIAALRWEHIYWQANIMHSHPRRDSRRIAGKVSDDFGIFEKPADVLDGRSSRITRKT